MGRAGRFVIGKDRFLKFRAKIISKHSNAIKDFVDTSDTKFGVSAMKRLFKLADTNKDGTICKEELKVAVNKLGFDWIDEKQIDGIFARADKDGNGVLDVDEFIAECPKLLKTNLVKLAKKNGGD